MTEKDKDHIDVFYRQALLGGNRVPVLWGGPFELLKMLHEEADVDVGDWGTAMDGIPEVESVEQANDLPWAARFLKCKDEVKDICKSEPRFCVKCWIDRDDNVMPEAEQYDNPKGQVKWHPGWRVHQLKGRNLAFAILEALQSAVNIWTEGVMGALVVLRFLCFVCEAVSAYFVSHVVAFCIYNEQVVHHWRMNCGMLPITMRTFATKLRI
jgi:translation initiation factor IF-1